MHLGREDIAQMDNVRNLCCILLMHNEQRRPCLDLWEDLPSLPITVVITSIIGRRNRLSSLLYIA